MQIQSMHFKARAGAKLADQVLQQNLKTFKGKFVGARAAAVADFNTIGDWEAVRSAGAAIRQRTLQQLDVWIERFEAEATRRGATVLFAEDGAEAAQLLLQLCQRHGVKKLVKSKSMVSEEASLNQVLSEAGVTPVETDLGEYILQIKDNEPPSHIIAPALHLNKDEVADLFAQVHGTPRKSVIEDMTREAREQLRGHFLSADMGVSGGNFLVAETGSVAIVTNEGNGRMVTTLPPVHVAITGIEKVVPTLEDLSTLLRLLPRSATGQSISNYVSLLTGRRGAQDQDGPQHMYFILVDNGRTGLLGGDMQPMLQCIRCGACMNHCPVYQTVGGHAYGWVYPGRWARCSRRLSRAWSRRSICRMPPPCAVPARWPVRYRSRCPICCAVCGNSRPKPGCGPGASVWRCVPGPGWHCIRGCMARSLVWPCAHCARCVTGIR